MINKKAVAIATVIIIALLTGFTIGYAVRSNIKRNQIYEKYIVNTTQNTTNEVLPQEDENLVTEE